MELDVHHPIHETSPSSSTFNQTELNDLVRDLELIKANSELLASRSVQENKNCWCTFMKIKPVMTISFTAKTFNDL